MAPADAARRLSAVPGIGVWTVAEIAQRALGDPDALSGRRLPPLAVRRLGAGRPSGRRRRHGRAARAVAAAPLPGRAPARAEPAAKPRFGPRLTIQDHRAH